MNRPGGRHLITAALLAAVAMPVSAVMPEIEIGVQQDGLYVIHQTDLVNAGIDVTAIDLARLELSNRGIPIPILLNDGNDGSFDAGDSLEFYGTGIPVDDPLYDVYDTHIYRLHESTVSGARMGSIDYTMMQSNRPLGNTPTPISADTFLFTKHFEQNNTYDIGIDFPADADNWFHSKALPGGQSQNLTFNIHTYDTSQNGHGQIKVHWQGKTADKTITNNHHTRLQINQCTLSSSDMTWGGISGFDQYAYIPSGCLKNGTNTFTAINVGDTGALVDTVFVDYFEVGYQKFYRANQDTLLFNTSYASVTLPGSIPEFSLTGFSDPNVVLFDITNPSGPTRYTNLAVNNVGTVTIPNYTVTFSEASSGQTLPHDYLLTVEANALAPAFIRVDTPSDLKSTNNQADYLILTTADMLQVVQPLADHRIEQGLVTKVIDVDDIYDEFNGGMPSDQALKDFLSYAYHNWAGPAPSHVLLFGDAGINYTGTSGSTPTYVPTHFFTTFSQSKAPTDTWFATVDGNDPLPDFFIGRLPATPSTADTMVQKMLDYDNNLQDFWTRNALIIADDDEALFRTTSNELVSLISSKYSSTKKIYYGDTSRGTNGVARSAAQDHQAIIDQLNAGSVVTAYTGHGTGIQWAFEGLLNSNDAQVMTNEKRLSFMVSLNCASGYFVEPWTGVNNQLTMAESFLAEPGGAVGFWAASHLGFTSDHRIVGKELFRAISVNSRPYIGQLSTEAYINGINNGASLDTMDSFIYFGDPATRLVEATAVRGGKDGYTGGGVFSVPMLIIFIILGLFVNRKRSKCSVFLSKV